MASLTPFSQSPTATVLLSFLADHRAKLTAPTLTRLTDDIERLPRSDLDVFTQGLREALDAHDIRVKQSNVRQLTARLNGFQNWQQAVRSLDRFVVECLEGPTEHTRHWTQSFELLAEHCLKHARSLPRELVVRANTAGLTLLARYQDAGDRTAYDGFLAAIRPLDPSFPWWREVQSPLEHFRRRLEEQRTFFIDGYLAARLCSPDYLVEPLDHPHRLTDCGNAELVLMHQYHGDPAHEMTEIARGDELECFAQLERAHDRAPGSLSIEVNEDAWLIDGKRRYVWALSTLRPQDYRPGLSTFYFSEPEISRLKHRYGLAQATLAQRTPRRPRVKVMDDLDHLRETYRVNQHAILLALDDKGLDWAGYHAQYPDDTPETLSAEMPIVELGYFAHRVPMRDLNQIFARPTRADLELATSDAPLRSLYQRVDHVTYRVPRDLSAELKETVQDMVREFSESLHAYLMIRAGVIESPIEHETAHLAWIDDAHTLFARSRDAGLTLHVGRVPRILLTPPELKTPEGVTPFSVGHSLYLDFDRVG